MRKLILQLLIVGCLFATTTAQAMTFHEKQALESAQLNLSFMPYSYHSLLTQLRFEGHSLKNATYAVNHCNADWMEQANESAINYLLYSNCTREELHKYLLFEGFLEDEASNAVTRAFESNVKEQLMFDANMYLENNPTSYAKLLELLVSSGYTVADSQVAIEQSNIDWMQQAALFAQNLTLSQTYSDSDLLNLLLEEGFSKEEADYGVANQFSFSLEEPTTEEQFTLTEEPFEAQSTSSSEEIIEYVQFYIDMMPFSYQGLITQLTFDNISEADAIAAIEQCTIDWKEQAVLSGKLMLEFSNYSEDDIAYSLSLEGFTEEEVQYAVAKLFEN